MGLDLPFSVLIMTIDTHREVLNRSDHLDAWKCPQAQGSFLVLTSLDLSFVTSFHFLVLWTSLRFDLDR